MNDLHKESVYVFDKINILCLKHINSEPIDDDDDAPTDPTGSGLQGGDSNDNTGSGGSGVYCKVIVIAYNFYARKYGLFDIAMTETHNQEFAVHDDDGQLYGIFDFYGLSRTFDYKHVQNIPIYEPTTKEFKSKYNANVHSIERSPVHFNVTDEHTEVAETIITTLGDLVNGVDHSVYDSGRVSFTEDGRRMKENIRGFKDYKYILDYSTNQVEMFREDGTCISYFGTQNNVYEPLDSSTIYGKTSTFDVDSLPEDTINDMSSYQDCISSITVRRANTWESNSQTVV